jgi:hypothetical protein
MELLLSAVLDELIIGSTNFFTSQFSRLLMLDVEDSLRWVLLQAEVIDDEALGRMDPETHLRCLQLARKIARMQNGSLNSYRK